MPKKITAYQAGDGSIHEDECAAATRDVELLVAGSPLAENQPYAKTLVAWLTQHSKAIRKVLETHEQACPSNVAEVASVERQTGPESEDPHMKNCGFHKGAACDCGAH